MTDSSSDRFEAGSVTEWAGGFDWIADPDERGQRASHALRTDAGVWLVDPVDTADLYDRVAELGEVAGVVVLHDRHLRDAPAVARRHDVAVHLPSWLSGLAADVSGPVERVSEALPGTDYDVHRLRDEPDWQEAVLLDEPGGTMVVPEAVGTLSSFEGDGPLGVHPSLDRPPERLADWRPERLLVGHGESLYEDATTHLQAALDGQ